MGGLSPVGKGWVRAVDSGIASQVFFFLTTYRFCSSPFMKSSHIGERGKKNILHEEQNSRTSSFIGAGMGTLSCRCLGRGLWL